MPKRSSYYMTIRKAQLAVNDLDDEVYFFDLTPEGADRFIEFFDTTADDAPWQNSSTLDFPEEEGAPEGWSIEDWAKAARERQQEREVEQAAQFKAAQERCEKAAQQALNAIKVMTLTPAIITILKDRDPKALEQMKAAGTELEEAFGIE